VYSNQGFVFMGGHLNTFIKIVFFTLFFPLAVSAGSIYKWVDSEGKTHFTDNPATIPLSQEEYDKREFKDTALIGKAEVHQDQSKISQGKVIWESRCSTCHFLGASLDNSVLRELPSNILDPNTSLESITKNLKYSLELRSGDMGDIKLSDEEIEAVGSYIISRTTKF
jgi:mono/diheme cytochrome c family protein